jgi:hypothetical protein
MRSSGDTDTALTLIRTALEKKQATPEWTREDPDFHFIRNDLRSAALMDEFSTNGEEGTEGSCAARPTPTGRGTSGGGEQGRGNRCVENVISHDDH